MEFDYAILYVPDVEDVAGWYSEKLGLEPDVASPGFVRVRGDGGFGVAIHQGEPLEHPERVKLEFQVDDVDETYERLREKGVVFVEPPSDVQAGFRSVTTTDPAGHAVEFRSGGE